uniref:NECAP PHear domain-containing protein n=1 Tax=Lotharella globosa TaxID=91324 RepID=A0A7S4DP43_9EUKA
MSSVEATVLRIDRCKVYRLPPMSGAKGYMAKEWDVNNPMAEVKLNLTTLNDDMFFKFVTKEGKLFAKSIKLDGRLVASGDKMLEYYIDKVSDSSRFFVVKIQNPRTKKVLPIGIGFSDRENAMSLNASIDDHIKQVEREIEYEKMKSEKGTSAVKDDEDDLVWKQDHARTYTQN